MIAASERRTGKALIEATRAYSDENAAQSWAAVLSTVALWIGLLVLAGSHVLPVWLRLAVGVFAALVVVRTFVLYHDHLHGSLLRSSKPARAFFWLFGVWVMAPPRVWRETHNYHHAHTAKLVGSHIGSFPTQTVQWWRSASPGQRRGYAFVRHPLTVMFAYFTAFLLEMCVLSFARAPRKRWDSLLSLFVTLGLCAVVTHFFGFEAWLLGVFVPQFLSCALGAYLFYAQHNFPELVIQPRETWTYDRAALESSSFMDGSPFFHWWTANIGYHHVHHLNPGIPFYRLPEAMAGIPELQNPGVVRLEVGSLRQCFALKLWDAEQGRMVPFPRD